MKVNCFQLDGASGLRKIPIETVLSQQSRAEAPFWVDLEFLEDEPRKEWLDKLGVEGLSRRLCLEAWDRPGYYPLHSEIFLVLPLSTNHEREGPTGSCAFLCRENLLITLHAQTLLRQDHFNELEKETGWIQQPSIGALVSVLLMDISMRNLSATTRLRSRIGALNRRMERDPDSVSMADILKSRSELLALATLVGDQIPVLKALSESDRPTFQCTDCREYLNCATVNLEASSSTLEMLDGRLKAIFFGFQMHTQKKTTQRLDTLTILSAIFMPITLLAGIWGMNFETMPELSWPHGYAFGLSFMALVGAVMFFFFRRTGWFS